MRILALGGTLFLGRHLVEAALARGHEVTLFNRGRTGPELFPDLEHLRGDRDAGDLDALRGREWDAAIDTSGYVPRVVRESAELLAGAVERYAFVSSLSVFAPPLKRGLTERDPVGTIADAASEDVQQHYGPLKALCERAVAETLPGRTLVLRPGIVAGPHDPTNRFTYWARRLAEGGDVLAPATVQPVQLIDARDLAGWTVELLERGAGGVFHATAPPMPFTEMLEECLAATGSAARIVAVPEDFLLARGVEPLADLPLWLALGRRPELSGFFTADGTKAVVHGLRFRPLRETARDVAGEQGPTTFREREAAILRAWRAAA